MKRFITIPRSQHQGILPHLMFSHSLGHAENGVVGKIIVE
jgi:hypothetical protein